MTENHVPINEEVVEAVASEFHLDAATLRDSLAAANELHRDVICEVRALHNVVGETVDQLLALDESGREWDVVAEEICARVDGPDRETLSAALRACHNRHVETIDSSALGEGVTTTEAVDGADAVIVDKRSSASG